MYSMYSIMTINQLGCTNELFSYLVFSMICCQSMFHQTKCQLIKVGPIIGHGPESKNNSDRLKQNSAICYQVWIINDIWYTKTSATSGHNLTQIPWEETLRNFSAWDEAWILTLLCKYVQKASPYSFPKQTNEHSHGKILVIIAEDPVTLSRRPYA